MGVKQHRCVQFLRQCVCILNEKKPWSYSLEKTIWAITPPVSGVNDYSYGVTFSQYRYSLQVSEWDKTQIYLSSNHPPGRALLPLLHSEKAHRKEGLKICVRETDMPQEEIHKPCLNRKFSNTLFWKIFFFKGSTILDTFNLLLSLRAETPPSPSFFII